MTTTCATIIERARSMSTLNTPLTSDSSEMLSRISADQQALFTGIAGLTRDRFQTAASVTSSPGASARTIDLSALSLPVERILRFDLADGREVNQVDVLDLDAELEPRYLVRAQTIVEVEDDWSPTTSSAVSGTVTYVYGPAAITTTGATSQPVTVPDAWCDLLVIPLAQYLFQKDPGRDTSEHDRLARMLDERTQAFVSYLSNYGGVESRRFTLPAPASTRQKP